MKTEIIYDDWTDQTDRIYRELVVFSKKTGNHYFIARSESAAGGLATVGKYYKIYRGDVENLWENRDNWTYYIDFLGSPKNDFDSDKLHNRNNLR